MEGTICEADTVIMVHDLPNAHFQILTDSLCLNDQNFCVRDLSDMGNTTSVYDNRIVVWGDGGISLDDDPGSGVDICYSGYIDQGSFTITAEIKNDNGCEAKWSDTVEVLPVVRRAEVDKNKSRHMSIVHKGEETVATALALYKRTSI
jgi:hypothetical protein